MDIDVSTIAGLSYVVVISSMAVVFALGYLGGLMFGGWRS